MTYEEIKYCEIINEVDLDKVEEIAKSIKTNGWVGSPILVSNDTLITGSHRLAALQLLNDRDELDFDMDVAEDVTDIIEAAFEKFENENGYTPELQYDDLGWIFEGTWVEKYKDEIAEW